MLYGENGELHQTSVIARSIATEELRNEGYIAYDKNIALAVSSVKDIVHSDIIDIHNNSVVCDEFTC
ncbi:MAG: hypothetical protein V3T58_04765 [Candidatus Hydrothermarchaeales archaeon]